MPATLSAARRVARALVALSCAAALAACSSTRVIDTWEADEQPPAPPQKVAVLAMAGDSLVRESFENLFAEDLRDAGSNAVASYDLRGMRGKLTREKVEAALEAADVDGLIVVFLTGGGVTEVYERSNYEVDPVGTGVYWDWYGPSFVNVYEVSQGHQRYDVEAEVLVETSYIDFPKRQPVWRVVTASKDLQYQDAGAAVSHEIVNQMRRHGLIP